MAWLERIRSRARDARTESVALALAARHPRTPWPARLVVAAVVLYAVTPIDLVPDFIPVVGLLDDLVFVGLAVALARRLVPAPVMAECRARAAGMALSPANRRFAYLVAVSVWLGVALAAGVVFYTNYAA